MHLLLLTATMLAVLAAADSAILKRRPVNKPEPAYAFLCCVTSAGASCYTNVPNRDPDNCCGYNDVGGYCHTNNGAVSILEQMSH